MTNYYKVLLLVRSYLCAPTCALLLICALLLARALLLACVLLICALVCCLSVRCCLLVCYYIRQCNAMQRNATMQNLLTLARTPKIKTLTKQSFMDLFKIFCDFLKITRDLMRLLLHNAHNNKASVTKKF